MSQIDRHPGPGTLVRDALAIELMGDGSGGTTSITGTGAETAVVSARPANVSAEMTIGAVTGTSVDVMVAIQGADDSAFTTNVVTYGVFDSVGETDDNTVRRMDLVVYKPYIRANTVRAAGTTPNAALSVILHTKDDRRSNTATA